MFDFDKALAGRQKQAAKERQDQQERLAKTLADAESLEVAGRAFCQAHAANVSVIRNGPDVFFTQSSDRGINLTAKGGNKYSYKLIPNSLPIGTYPPASSQNLTEAEVQELILVFLGM